MEWETVIGLEVHAQLLTQSKAFSGASTKYGAAPNTQACAVDIALPGVLPVFNKEATRMAVKLGLAVGAKINHRSIFARKNYFYPDLPKGYQISQYETPVVTGGVVEIVVDGRQKSISLTRAHLEEDAGKSLHEGFHNFTGIDLNRAGTPLLEIVSEPEMRSAEEAVAYARALHSLVRWIGICDGNMQEGSFRCDANVSVRKAGDPKLGTRCEIKNLNSFRFMEQAIAFEAKRQIELIEDGGKVVQETRLYDPERNETRSMRSKEDAQDYRYFPDPDLLPLVISERMIEEVRKTMPELPQVKRRRIEARGVPAHVAGLVTSSRDRAEFFEASISAADVMRFPSIYESTANAINGEIASYLNENDLPFSRSPLSAFDLAAIQTRVADGTVSGKAAKDLLRAKLEGEKAPVDALIEQRGLQQISDAGEIEKLVDEAIAAGAKQVEDYRAGKEKALQSLVGQVMKASRGKANPAQVSELLRRRLKA